MAATGPHGEGHMPRRRVAATLAPIWRVCHRCRGGNGPFDVLAGNDVVDVDGDRREALVGEPIGVVEVHPPPRALHRACGRSEGPARLRHVPLPGQPRTRDQLTIDL